jgi:hypothetical protein
MLKPGWRIDMPLNVECMQMPNMPIDCIYHHYIQDKSEDQREKLAAMNRMKTNTL